MRDLTRLYDLRAYEALDPRHRLIDSVFEPLAIHGIRAPAERRARAERMLGQVELRPASRLAAMAGSEGVSRP